MQTFTIAGVAVPQGSKAVTRNGVIFDSNKNLKPWRRHATASMSAQRTTDTYSGAVDVHIVVYLPRPKTVTRQHPHVKPDVDKLARALLDSATDAHVWNDDSQVCALYITKLYTTDEPMVRMTIMELDQ